MLAYGFDCVRPAFSFANHAEQARSSQHSIRELIHPSRCGGASRSHHLIADRIDGPDVVDESVGKVHAFGKRRLVFNQIADSFMGRVAPCQDFAGQEQRVTRLPLCKVLTANLFKVHATALVGGLKIKIRPVVEAGRFEMRRPCAVKRKMDMSCSCTIGNHSDGQRRRVSRVVE